MSQAPIVNTDMLETDFNRFPDLETYDSNLQLLKTMDLKDASLLDIKKAYDKYATIIPSIFSIRTPEQFNQLCFYRVRMNIVDEDLDLFRTYSYPSPHLSKSNGRANLKGKTVFYCSNNPYAAIIESKPQINETGYLSVWKAQTTRNLKFGVLLPQTLSPKNIWYEMAMGAFKYAEKHSVQIGKDKAKHLIMLHQFIADLFVSEQPPYSLTSMIADHLIYDTHTWRDFILYPSVASNGHYCNFAFHPNIVDQFLRFEKVIPFVVKKIHSNYTVQYTAGQIGKIKNASIFWDKKVTIDEVNFNNLPFD